MPTTITIIISSNTNMMMMDPQQQQEDESAGEGGGDGGGLRAVWADVGQALVEADMYEDAMALLKRWVALFHLPATSSSSSSSTPISSLPSLSSSSSQSTSSRGSPRLTTEERGFFSNTFRGCISSARAAHRSITSMYYREQARGDRLHQQQQMHEMKMRLLVAARERIVNDIRRLCHDCVELIDRYLLPFCRANEDHEGVVYCLTKQGEHWRYLADVEQDAARVQAVQATFNAYSAGLRVSQEKLPATHVMKMCLALRLSAYFVEEGNHIDEACQVACEAINEALTYAGGREALNQHEHRDAAMVVPMLEDYLAEWEPQLNDVEFPPEPSL